MALARSGVMSCSFLSKRRSRILIDSSKYSWENVFYSSLGSPGVSYAVSAHAMSRKLGIFSLE